MQNILDISKKEFIYGAHLASLISPSLVLSAQILLNLEINYIYIAIAYLITLIIYSYNYQKEFDTDFITNPEKVTYLEKRKKYYPFIMVFYIVLLLFLTSFVFNPGFVMFVLLILVGGILYTLIFKILTKDIPGFKSLYITSIYAYATTFFIISYYALNLNLLIITIFLLVFIKMFIAVVYFDIKDMESDSIENLKTLPNILGKKNTIILLSILNIIQLLMVLYSIYVNILPLFSISFVLLFCYTEYYLIRAMNANPKKMLFYSYIMVDGEFAIWVVVLIISKAIYYHLIL